MSTSKASRKSSAERVKAGSKTSARQSDYLRWLLPVGIAICVFVAFLPILDTAKKFTNWDDNQYVTEQPLVKQLNGETISAMFDTSTQVAANYHPLTMLSLAIDYEISGEKASGFARTNLIIHIINSMLVFVLYPPEQLHVAS